VPRLCLDPLDELDEEKQDHGESAKRGEEHHDEKAKAGDTSHEVAEPELALLGGAWGDALDGIGVILRSGRELHAGNDLLEERKVTGVLFGRGGQVKVYTAATRELQARVNAVLTGGA
jgi:hypothetical protein